VWYPIGVTGGCSYKREDVSVETFEKREESTWQTGKVIDDVEEYKAAQALRNKAKRYLRKLGAPAASAIVIVPLDKEDEVDAVRRDLKREVVAFNSAANFSQVNFRCYKYRIAGENEDLLKDMLVDLRDILVELRQAEQAADFKGIRSVVQRLAGFDTVLPERAADYLQRAIADAKAQANDIEKSLNAKSKTLAEVKRQISTSSVDFARFAVMEPGSELPDVDNELVQRMVAAQAQERGATIEFRTDIDADTPDFSKFANGWEG